MSVHSTYYARRPASDLDEELPAKRRCNDDADVKQATAIVGELLDKAGKLMQLFDSIVREYQNKVIVNPTFGSHYIKLGEVRHKLFAYQTSLQNQPQSACASILSQQNEMADTLLWLNKLEHTVAMIVSQII